jgi:hypothetical protein
MAGVYESLHHISKFFLIVLAFGSMTACMKTFTLQNGRTKVPTKTLVYKNKVNFEKALLNVVDTAVVYEEFNKRYNVLTRLDNHIETSFYAVYRFYPNGELNYFVLDRDRPQGTNDFNPEYKGYRGVYYSEKSKIKYDLFAPSNELRWIGKLTGEFTFSGDTLYVRRDESPKEVDIYIKRTLPPEYFQYKANW